MAIKVIKNFYPPMKDLGGMRQPAHDKYVEVSDSKSATVTSGMIRKGLMAGMSTKSPSKSKK